MAETMERREASSRQNMPARLRDVHVGLEKKIAAISNKGYSEEQLSVGYAAYVLRHFCPTPFQSFMKCSKTNGGDASKCNASAAESLQCEAQFQLQSVVSMMRPPPK